MKNKTRVYLAVFLFISLVIFAGQQACYGRGGAGHNLDSMPAPTLLYPVVKDIDLGSKPFLEFKWERTDSYLTDHYDFKLYKSSETGREELLVEKRIYENDYPFSLDVSILEAGQAYTWSLVQVYNEGEKSDKSYGSFKIIKK